MLCGGLTEEEMSLNHLIMDSGNNVPGVQTVNKFGRNFNVDATATTIWDSSDTPVWLAPTSAVIHDITSTSAEDRSTGTGMQTMRLYGLTSWNSTETSEDIALNTTTKVPTVNPYVIIHRMHGLTWSSSATNGGDIAATARGDTTDTAQIHAGEGQTQMAIYGIPSTHTAYMTGWYASVVKSGAAGSVKVEIQYNPQPGTNAKGFLIKHTSGLMTAGTSSLRHPYDPWKRFAGPGILKMTAFGSAANFDVSGGFDLVLVRN